MNKSTEKQLRDVLAKHAYQHREEPFTLASGATSHHYVNCKRVLLDPLCRLLAGQMILDAITGRIMMHLELAWPDALAGVALGGVPLVDTVSMQTGLPAIYVRPEAKTHGAGSRVEAPYTVDELRRDSLWPRHTLGVVLLEDVTTTGGSSLRAAQALDEAGFRVSDIVTLIDREEGAADLLRAENIRLHACFTLDELKLAGGVEHAP